ncbi:helix-turn-helix transcriptional regulator [Streptomyces sp. NPDC000983]|uniref:helix-turn-helix transcriptional regulator n=1 Tax=Streptomyces sp. NPDC000983 TaxID=3154373 RepID=UPI003326AD53
MVEHLTDGSSVSRRIDDLLGGEPREFVHMKRRAREQSNKVYDPAPFRRLLAAGLRSRTLFAAETLEDPEQAAYARSSHAMGDLHRVTVEPFRHLAVVNGSVAFVQADPADPFAGALQIRQPGVVAMPADVFEGMWARARELDDLPLSPIEQRVLRALTEHGTDEAGARSLNVSVRKFRSHVADLMARLGASTRFQAALRAKELGWL